MKVWPIDPLVPRNLRLEVPEKLTVRGDFSPTVSLVLGAGDTVSVLAFCPCLRPDGYQQPRPSGVELTDHATVAAAAVKI